MRIVTVFLSLALLFLVSIVSIAQTPVKESFNYPLPTIAGLGSAANGFGGPWLVDTSAHGAEGKALLAGGVFNSSLLDYAMPDTGNQIQVTLVNAWSDAQRYKRALAAPWPNTAGKTYWVSYLLDVKTALQPNSYFFLKLYSTDQLLSGSGELVAIGKSGGQASPVFSCGSGWTGDAPDASSRAIDVAPVWVVVRFDMNGATTGPGCRTFMWISPNPATAPDTNKAIVKRFTSMPNGFNAIALEFGGDVSTTPVQFVIDRIKIANSFADLSAATPTGAVAKESFIYSLQSIGGLGKAGNGFAGSWLTDTSAHGAEGKALLAGGVFRSSLLDYAIPDTGNSLQVTLVNAWSDAQRYKRALAAPWPNTAGKTYWVSYLLDVKTALQPNTYFFLKLYNSDVLLSGAGELVAIGKSGGQASPVFSCGSGWTGDAPDASSRAIDSNPVWLVARFDMNGTSAGCKTYMWVSPNPAVAPDTAKAIVKRLTPMPNGFNAIAIEFGGDVSTTPVQFIVDKISIATSYSDLLKVTKVNGPATLQPTDFALLQNYPNPFNPSTVINYSQKTAGNVRLTVYNILGKEVAELVNGSMTAGAHQVTFNASNLSSGVYFYRLESAGATTITNKMLLMK